MNRQNLRKRKKSAAPGADAARLAALLRDTEDTERRRIRALLKLPLLKRTNFLRVKIGRGSAL